MNSPAPLTSFQEPKHFLASAQDGEYPPDSDATRAVALMLLRRDAEAVVIPPP
jgi:hypothetical protein